MHTMPRSLSRRFLDSMFELTSLITEGCVVKGDIRCKNALVLAGTVIGNGHIQGGLQIVQEGRWEGDVQGGEISIAGTVEGDVRSEGKLEILTSATIKGSIFGSQIAVAKGAQIYGEMVVRDGAEVQMFEEQRKNR